MNKASDFGPPCRHRLENPDKSSVYQFYCQAARMPIDGEALPNKKGQMKKTIYYLSCSYCILYDKEVSR